MSPAELQAAKREYDLAYYGGASSETIVAAGRHLAELEEAADLSVKAKRLRTKASDERAAYQRHMDAYGEAIGRSQHRLNTGEIEMSRSFAREAVACLACATDCLIAAEQAEREADGLNRWIVLFDGVSAKREAA